jgi:protein-histidine pros-kinase
LQQNAREEILQNARLMMEAALSSRTYTVNQVKPLLETHMKYEFLPQTVPAYAATEQFNELRKCIRTIPTRRRRSIRPIRAIAADWEADVVNIFRNTPTTTEWIGSATSPAGRSLYLRGRSRSRTSRASTATAMSSRSQTMLDSMAARTASAGRWTK